MALLFALLLPFMLIGPPLVILFFTKAMIDKSFEEEDKEI